MLCSTSPATSGDYIGVLRRHIAALLRIVGQVEQGDGRPTYLEPDELRQMNAVYGAALTIADTWLGEFIGRFRELGLHENTALVFVSDHGILLGERGWTGKIAQELHPELIQVPYVMVHPEGKAAGTTSSYFASTQDVAPTLLSMAG